MAIVSADLKWKKPLVESDGGTNGGRISNTTAGSTYFPAVPSTERATGITRYRKLFLKNEQNNAGKLDLTLYDGKVFLKTITPGGILGGVDEAFLIKAGTDTDTQTNAEGYTNWSGVGILGAASYSAGATSIEVLCENNDAFKTAGLAFIGYYDTAGDLITGEFVTISNCSWVSNTATLTVTALLNDYARYVSGSDISNADIYASTTIGKTGSAFVTNEFANMFVLLTGGTGAGQVRKVVSNTATTLTVDTAWTTVPDGTTDFAVIQTYVSMVEEVGDVVCSVGTVTVTSAAGTFDDAYLYLYPVGAVTEDWTITFSSATAYTAEGDNHYGTVITGDITAGVKPTNSGSGSYFFEMAAAGFGGTFSAGDTITFSTINSAKSVWLQQTVGAGAAAHPANFVVLMAEGDS